MLRLGSVVVGAHDVRRAVDFWSAALGYDVVEFPGSEDEFVILRHRSGEGTRVAIQLSEVDARETPRVHLDLVVDTADEQRSEVERLVALGAVEVDWDLYPDDPDFVVLSDPDGNRFCVVDASHG